MKSLWRIGAASAVLWTVACMGDSPASEDVAAVPFEDLFRAEQAVPLRTLEADPIGRVEDVTLWAGRVAVVDGLGRNVKIFELDGSLAMTLGRRGDGPGEFRFPVAAAVDERNRLAVLDMANGRVSFFTREGEFDDAFQFAGGFTGRMEALNGGRRLLVTSLILDGEGEPRPHVGHVFELSGERVRSFGIRPERTAELEGLFLGTVMTAISDTLAVWGTNGRHSLQVHRIGDALEPKTHGGIEIDGSPAFVVPVPGFRVPDFASAVFQDEEELFLWATRQELLMDLVGGPELVIARFESGDARRGNEVHRYALVPLHGEARVLATKETSFLIQKWVGNRALGVTLDDGGEAYLYWYQLNHDVLPRDQNAR